MTAEEPSPASPPAFKLESRRWTQTDRIVGIATFVLLVSLFLSWYSVNVLGIRVGAANGLYHGYMYLTLLICLALLAYYVAKAGLDRLPVKLPAPESQLVTVATAVNAVLTVIAFLTKPSVTSWDFGAYIGLIAALVALAPAVLARRSGARAPR